MTLTQRSHLRHELVDFYAAEDSADFRAFALIELHVEVPHPTVFTMEGEVARQIPAELIERRLTIWPYGISGPARRAAISPTNCTTVSIRIRIASRLDNILMSVSICTCWKTKNAPNWEHDSLRTDPTNTFESQGQRDTT